MRLHWARSRPDVYDYVIVGAGSAGCVVAGRLAEAGASVLLLEAGGTDRRPDVFVPVGTMSVYARCNWKYLPEPDDSKVHQVEAWAAGRIVGGSGSINGTVFVRGNRADFDGWAQRGCVGWDYESVLPSFRRLESWAGPPSQFRGATGPIHVRHHAMPHPAVDAFMAAAVDAGHPETDDYNGLNQEGSSVVQVNQRRRSRSQSSREYLRGVAGGRVDVRTHCVAGRIRIEGGRAVGVDYLHRGKHLTATAGEVIVSAGTFATPKVLMLSGIGPQEELDRHGIPVVHASPGVGHDLQEQIGVIQRWQTTLPTLNELRPIDGARALVDYLCQGSGPLMATVFQAQVIHRSTGGLEWPDFQHAFASFAIVRRGAEGMLEVKPAQVRSVMVSSALLHPRARGRVHLRSTDPLAPPVISHRLLGHPEDVEDVLAGMAEVRRIMAEAPVKEILVKPFPDEASCRTDEDWRDFLRANVTYGVHPVGTCRMGTDEHSVVDPELRVRGVNGLRVVDASVMPTETSGNTNAPTMMIAERGADLILGRPT